MSDTTWPGTQQKKRFPRKKKHWVPRPSVLPCVFPISSNPSSSLLLHTRYPRLGHWCDKRCDEICNAPRDKTGMARRCYEVARMRKDMGTKLTWVSGERKVAGVAACRKRLFCASSGSRQNWQIECYTFYGNIHGGDITI